MSTRHPPVELRAARLIQPARRRIRLRDLKRDAGIIRVLTARDFKVKYKQSVLGPLWLLFQPLAMLAAFLIAFQGLGDVRTSDVPYALFSLVGLSVWAFFQASMTIGTASIVTNFGFVRYTPCPRHTFPIAAVIASVPAFAVPMTATLVAVAATGHISPRAVLLPAALAWLFVLILGVVAITSSLTVRYRDINSALPFLLQIGIFLAPIGYPLADLSDPVRALIGLNPLTGIIEASRWMTLSGYAPSIEPIAVSVAATLALVVVGWRLFTRLETTMADDI
jgi:lipopolysaccharide transport system permease protein